MIERFNMVRHADHEHCGLESDPEGAFVTYRDHEARVAELEEENRILKNAEADLRSFANNCNDRAQSA